MTCFVWWRVHEVGGATLLTVGSVRDVRVSPVISLVTTVQN